MVDVVHVAIDDEQVAADFILEYDVLIHLIF